jgi:hypothetical protein
VGKIYNFSNPFVFTLKSTLTTSAMLTIATGPSRQAHAKAKAKANLLVNRVNNYTAFRAHQEQVIAAK